MLDQPAMITIKAYSESFLVVGLVLTPRGDGIAVESIASPDLSSRNA
jgi:hypothetical protein